MGAWLNAIPPAPATNVWTENIRILNCKFKNANVPITLRQVIRNVLIQSNEFVYVDGPQGDYDFTENVSPATVNTTNEPPTRPAIYGWGGRENIAEGGIANNMLILDNTLNGRLSQTVRVEQGQRVYGADGLFWMHNGGNYFIARNKVQNYVLEGVQCNSGPFAAVQNTFPTLFHNASTAAFVFTPSKYNAAEHAQGAFGTAVGNDFDGGTFVWLSNKNATTNCVTVSGNTARLDPPYQIWPSGDSALGYFFAGDVLNISGNTVTEGFRGITIPKQGKHVYVLNNDFGSSYHGGVFYLEACAGGTDLAVIARNILTHGASFDSRAPLSEGRNLFFIENDFTGGRTNIIVDSSALPIHFTP